MLPTELPSELLYSVLKLLFSYVTGGSLHRALLQGGKVNTVHSMDI